MKNINVLFQMDPLSQLTLEVDSTCKIAKEALLRGHKAYFSEPKDIFYLVDKVLVKCSRLILSETDSLNIVKSKNNLDLEDFDVVFIRQDPPFNMNYISNTYIHDLHHSRSPFFINRPSGIRNFTEKLFPLAFNDLIPQTGILGDQDEILNFVRTHKKVVIKPLYEKGGNGVSLVTSKDKDLLVKINRLTNNFSERIVVQEFLKNVSKGDKRVLLLDGEPVGAINRIPPKNQFKANLHLGARAEKTKLSRAEEKICERLKPLLIENGLFFVGIDIIDEKLTEINVTSPTGIHHLNMLDKRKIETTMWKAIEDKIFF